MRYAPAIALVLVALILAGLAAYPPGPVAASGSGAAAGSLGGVSLNPRH
jgi:hypothetical protein